MLNWLWKPIFSKAGKSIAIAVGFGALVGTLSCGLLMADKTGGVILASGGGIVGAFLLHPVLRSLFSSEDSVVLMQENEELKDQVEVLKREIPRQREEIERLEQQRIHVDGFRAVMKLSLVHVDMSLYDVSRRRFNKKREAVASDDQVLKAGEYEYLAVMRRQFKANLGVDLGRIGVTEQPGQLVISGIESESQGFENLKTDWPVREVRCQERSVTSPSSGELVVRKDHPDFPGTILTLSEEQSEQVQQRLNQGTELKSLDCAIRDKARQVISELLHPLGREIVFSESDVTNATPLFNFIRSYNDSISSKIQALQGRRASALPASVV